MEDRRASKDWDLTGGSGTPGLKGQPGLGKNSFWGFQHKYGGIENAPGDVQTVADPTAFALDKLKSTSSYDMAGGATTAMENLGDKASSSGAGGGGGEDPLAKISDQLVKIYDLQKERLGGVK